jgi:hypothetical protein
MLAPIFEDEGRFDERPCKSGRRSANPKYFAGKPLIIGRLAGREASEQSISEHVVVPWNVNTFGFTQTASDYYGRVVRLRGPDSSESEASALISLFSTRGGPSCGNDDKIAHLPRERRFLTAIGLSTLVTGWITCASSVIPSLIPRYLHRQVRCLLLQLPESPQRSTAYNEFD